MGTKNLMDLTGMIPNIPGNAPVNFWPTARLNLEPTPKTVGYSTPIWLENTPFAPFLRLSTQMAKKNKTDYTGMIPNLPGMPRLIFGPHHT